MERTYLTGNEYSALQSMFGFVGAWEAGLPRLQKRLEAAGLSEKAEQVKTLADEVVRETLRTVPVNKLAHIREELSHVTVYTRVEAPGIRTMRNTNYAYLTVSALNDLLNHMIKTECVLCDLDAADAKKCPYRKLIEAALPHSVGKDHSTEHCMYSDMVIGLGVQE
jgi:hypothetical protein